MVTTGGGRLFRSKSSRLAARHMASLRHAETAVAGVHTRDPVCVSHDHSGDSDLTLEPPTFALTGDDAPASRSPGPSPAEKTSHQRCAF